MQFLDNELTKWDEFEDGADSLVLTFFSDERPLRGAAGLADWRLCGQLSRLIKRSRINGDRGESLLLPPGRRLPFHRIFMFGLGDSHGFNETKYRSHVRWIREVVNRANIQAYATQPPGRATGLIGARRALDLWLDESDKDKRDGRVIIIEDHSGQKEMAEILRYRGKRSSS